jgi:hypothetical protein
MSDITVPAAREALASQVAAAAPAAQSCEECLGSGGWFRYEPALEPSPGLLYLRACSAAAAAGRRCRKPEYYAQGRCMAGSTTSTSDTTGFWHV